MTEEQVGNAHTASALTRELMLRDSLRAAGVGWWQVDLREDRMNWSDTLLAIFGVDESAVTGSYAQYRSFVHPEDGARVARADPVCRPTVDGDQGGELEYRIVRPDGGIRHVRERGEVRRDRNGSAVSAAGILYDVTEQRLAQLELARSTRALQMIRRCNTAVLRAQSESVLLEEVCRIAVDIGGYRMASVHFASDDPQRSLVLAGHAGHEAGYFSEVAISWSPERPEGNGPAGRAMRSGLAVEVTDVDTDPRYAPWAAAARKRGYRSVISLPLRSHEHNLGIFGLYSAEARGLAPAEIELLHELAEDLAFGIVGLRLKAERQRMIDTATMISHTASSSTGSAFFEKLLQALLRSLGAQAGFISADHTDAEGWISPICAVVDGAVLPHLRYALSGTPCEDIREGEDLVIERDVCVRYPRSSALAALGAQAYVGRGLFDSTGARIGTIFILYREPLRQRALAASMLRIFGERVVAEIVRQRDEGRVREQALLLDKAQDAIFVRTLDERVVYWNQGAQRLYGWSAAEVQDRCVLDFKVADAAAFRAASEQLRRDGEWLGELEEKCKDGSHVVVECRWTLVIGDDGAPQSILAINTNVTERKLAEARLAQSEARAAHAQKLESIGQLTGGIAHDFNNLLTVIIGNSEELSERLRDRPELATLARMVQSCGERGAELTSRLLAFARRQALEPKRIDLGEAVEGMLALIRRTLGEHIRIENFVDGGVWAVNVDPNQLGLAMLNLCINARDAMPDGGRLMIEIANVVIGEDYAGAGFDIATGEYVMIAITDTGCGIQTADLPRVFDPFFTTKAPGKGTGLGLSMVYGFTKQSGGNVKVYSEVGSGTVVKLYLPRAQDGSLGNCEQPGTIVPRRLEGDETILLVEDDDLVRGHAERLLEGLGYRVLVATNGPDALKIAGGEHAIDLLFTDVMMPGGMNGPQLALRVRELRPGLPVLYTSGYTENAIVHHARVDAGVNLLHKPYDRRALALKIRQTLGDNVSGADS